MKCTACGNNNADNTQFCRECGTSLNASVTSGAGIGSPKLSMVNFPDAVKLGFQRYVDFKGRSSRAEYWWWTLFIVVVFVALSVIVGFMGALGLYLPDPLILLLNSLFVLALIIPSLALGARRLHDINRSGWWILLFIYIFPNAYVVFALALVVSIAAGISVGITGFIVPYSVGFLLIISVPAWWIRWMFRQGGTGSNKYGSYPRHAISQQPYKP